MTSSTSVPRVSVIIPTHNRAAVLPRCLGSVLAQTFENLEVIFADDGSSDHTEAVVTAVQDRRVVYLKLPVASGGCTRPRNEALKIAR